MSRTTELGRLNQWKTTFTNGKLPECAPLLAEYGYDKVRMDEGEALLDDLTALYNQRQRESAEAREANEIFNNAYEDAMRQYRLHRRTAKSVLLEDTAVWDKYGLVGSFAKSYLSQMDTARRLYTGLLEDMPRQPLFTAAKLPPEEAIRMLAVLDDVAAKQQKYTLEEGESQDATQQKNEMFERMELWMRRFYGIARVALAERPQLLESLGVKVKS